MKRLLLVLLAGCSVSQEDFEETYPVQSCAFAMACYPYAFEDTASCSELPGDTGDCFSDTVAASCLDALAALDCPPGDTDVVWPESCQQVHACSK